MSPVAVLLLILAVRSVCAANPTIFSDVSVPNPYNISTAASQCGLPAVVNSSSSLLPCLCNPNAILSNSTISGLQLSLTNFSSAYADTICVLVVQQIESASGTATAVEAAAFSASGRQIWASDGGFNEPRSVLVLLDINDHQLYISTGAAARLNISDSTATSIANSVVSALKAAQYDEAIITVVASIQTNLVQGPSSSSSGLSVGAIVGIVLGSCAALGLINSGSYIGYSGGGGGGYSSGGGGGGVDFGGGGGGGGGTSW
ncbi:hypothetical protein HDU82_008319 [Entophlyctis luteolus]|nr:hypothetical protein HDU82_008319 [Entophlyctis luteolus]